MLDEIPIFNSLKFLIVLNLLRHFNHHVYEKMIAFMVATNSQISLCIKGCRSKLYLQTIMPITHMLGLMETPQLKSHSCSTKWISQLGIRSWFIQQ